MAEKKEKEEKKKKKSSLGGLEPPTFRLTAERANRLRHRDALPKLGNCFIYRQKITPQQLHVPKGVKRNLYVLNCSVQVFCVNDLSFT